MKFLPYIIALALLSASRADEKGATVGEATASSALSKPVWVGFSVIPLSPEVRAHAPGVPDGVGFVVEKVYEGGPAEEAGVKPFDIVWKLDDQLLVNEAQLGALIRMRKEKDVVAFSVIRSGKSEALELVLEPMPARHFDGPVSPMEVSMIPPGVPGMPKMVVFPQTSVAEVSREDGSTARLTRVESGYQVVIRNEDSTVVYEGPVSGGEAAVPEEWQRSVDALIRGLRRSEDRNWGQRGARPRVVVPPVRE